MRDLTNLELVGPIDKAIMNLKKRKEKKIMKYYVSMVFKIVYF